MRLCVSRGITVGCIGPMFRTLAHAIHPLLPRIWFARRERWEAIIQAMSAGRHNPTFDGNCPILGTIQTALATF